MKDRLRRSVVVFTIVALVAACGGGGGEADVGADECAGVPADELAASGALCGDTGLRPVDGGFSFANWAGPVAEDAVSVTTAIAVFGEEAVCAKITDAGCVPFPAVQHWIDGTNSQMQGGRCEGMAVLSQRIHDGADAAARLQDQASRTADLRKETVPVAASISRWWVSQGFEPVIEATADAWEMEPSEIVAALVDAIENDLGATIGIYDHGAGHAVTPIAVTVADDGTYAVSVYDNNYPGEVTVLSVDPTDETWTYDVGAENSGAVPAGWSGGKSSIDYVLMADREGTQKVPWSADDRGERSKGSARVTVSTGGKSVAGLIIDVGSSTIDTRDLSTVSNGVKVYPNRGGIGTGAMVEIPDGLADVRIRPVVGELLDDTTTSVDLTLGIDAPGPGSQFVTDVLDADELGDDAYDDFSLTVSTDDEFESDLDVSDDGDIEVDVAYEEEGAEILLEDGQDLSIFDLAGDDGLDFELMSAEGEVLYEADFDGTSDTGDIGVANIDFDEETGEVEVGFDEIEVASVDDEILSVTAADDDESPDSASPDEQSPDDVTGDTDPVTTDPVITDPGESPDATNGESNDGTAPSDTTGETTPPDTEPPAPESPTDDTTDGG